MKPTSVRSTFVQPEFARDDLVDPRRDEAGAARDDQMGDAVEVRLLAQFRDRASASFGAASA